MMLYAVRIFKNKQWHVVRHYATHEAAEFFASSALTEIEWDIKEVTLDEANAVSA